MGRRRLGVMLLVGFALALVVLGVASAGTPAPAKYGGVLVVGLSGEPANLDPTLNNSGSAVPIYRAMCQTLYIRGGELERVPVLAAGAPVALERQTYVHRPVTQGDRVQRRHTVQRAGGRDHGPALHDLSRLHARRATTTCVDSVTATGPYTVVFHLKQRDAAFLSGDQNYVLSPTAIATEGAGFSANPICVGPFMFDHRVVGDNITLIKSHYYYDQKDIFLDKIVFKPMPDAAAAEAALEAGDIQAIDNVSPTVLDSVRENSSLRVIRAPQLGWGGVVINIGNSSGATSLPYQNVGTPLARARSCGRPSRRRSTGTR